jgi:hypothetical protein
MSAAPVQLLLQTTIQSTVDDWSIARFELLRRFLSAQRDAAGNLLFEVTARDRGPLHAPDPVLSTLDRSRFDAMFLFAVDTGDGLSSEDCAAIARFRGLGKGLLVARDHMDLGSSICALGGVGEAQHFHSRNPDPDVTRRVIDDPYTTSISWPNYHSGANGDYQHIEVVPPVHAVLHDPDSPTGAIRLLPAHPHEGGVDAPRGYAARVIARGKSQATGRVFNLAVAFEADARSGRAVAQSTFHHFADYNWDPRCGAPSFVTETPGDAMLHGLQGLADAHRYARNLALWLGGRPT